jgi:thiamine biosynthesis lipoprotein
VTATVSTASTVGRAAAATVRRVEQVMGFPVSLAVRGRHRDDAAGRDAWAQVLASLHEADRVFSTYRPDSWIRRLERGDVDLADCPPEVAEVLALGERARVESGNAFAVHRLRPDGVVGLDPSGVVKGWALERAAAALHALDDTGFCLSGGGDLLCRTAAEDDPPWRVGIEDPHDTRRLLATVPLRSGALATSGTAHRGQHIVDARTGEPPRGVAQVTVIGPSLTWADIDATAAFALGPDAASWLRTRTGRTGLVVGEDGSTVTT